MGHAEREGTRGTGAFRLLDFYSLGGKGRTRPWGKKVPGVIDTAGGQYVFLGNPKKTSKL